MKFFEIFNGSQKVAEMAEFSDGFAFVHYTVENFPKNQYGRAQAFKVQMTKQSWSYERVEREIDH